MATLKKSQALQKPAPVAVLELEEEGRRCPATDARARDVRFVSSSSLPATLRIEAVTVTSESSS
jgi:hypothetical protein